MNACSCILSSNPNFLYKGAAEPASSRAYCALFSREKYNKCFTKTRVNIFEPITLVCGFVVLRALGCSLQGLCMWV